MDAFADRLFGGNPAAVSARLVAARRAMQEDAAENDLAETAFYCGSMAGFHIRWFTPTVEVDLCGHATLASAYVVFVHDRHPGDVVEFSSKRFARKVRPRASCWSSTPGRQDRAVFGAAKCWWRRLGREPIENFKGKTDYLVVYGADALRRSLRTFATWPSCPRAASS